MPAGKVLAYSLHHLSDYELQGCHFFWYITCDGTDIRIKREVTKVLVHRTCATWQLKIFHILKHGLLKVGHGSRYYISLIDVAQNLTFIISLSEIFS